MTDTPPTPSYVPRHNPAAHRFEVQGDGQTAVADYELHGTVMRLTHTVVPPALEGRGIANALAHTAMAHARAHGFKVDPRCSYMQAYMQRHPETQDLRA